MIKKGNNLKSTTYSGREKRLKAIPVIPKKKWGQNFLKDQNILEKIIKTANITENDYVLEIGPGLGDLSKVILKYTKNLLAVEIDEALEALLRKNFEAHQGFHVINQDFLKLNLPETIHKVWPELALEKPPKIKVIANLPYYITSPILLKLYEYHHFFHSFTLMMQKEVALRLTSPPNNKLYNNLSIMTSYYTDAKIVMEVANTCFYPRPKVTSAVVHLVLKPEHLKPVTTAFWKFIRSCFANKRKILRNNLLNLKNEPHLIDTLLQNLQWDPYVRAENLTFDDFYELWNVWNQM